MNGETCNRGALGSLSSREVLKALYEGGIVYRPSTGIQSNRVASVLASCDEGRLALCDDDGEAIRGYGLIPLEPMRGAIGSIPSKKDIPERMSPTDPIDGGMPLIDPTGMDLIGHLLRGDRIHRSVQIPFLCEDWFMDKNIPKCIRRENDSRGTRLGVEDLYIYDHDGNMIADKRMW